MAACLLSVILRVVDGTRRQATADGGQIRRGGFSFVVCPAGSPTIANCVAKSNPNAGRCSSSCRAARVAGDGCGGCGAAGDAATPQDRVRRTQFLNLKLSRVSVRLSRSCCRGLIHILSFVVCHLSFILLMLHRAASATRYCHYTAKRHWPVGKGQFLRQIKRPTASAHGPLQNFFVGRRRRRSAEVVSHCGHRRVGFCGNVSLVPYPQ